VVGQDAVFDRTEQRRDHTEQEQRHEQHRHRVYGEAQHRDQRDADLGELEALRHHRLVVAVGELAAERREEEVGRDEDRGRERDERLGLGAADLEQDQKDQRVLEEIVAEGRKELGPEQRREAPRHEQGRGHGVSAVQLGPRPMRRNLRDDNLGKRTIAQADQGGGNSPRPENARPPADDVAKFPKQSGRHKAARCSVHAMLDR
jgi:hypothetical protein